MSTTLSNGFILPVDGDKGQSLFDDLESNIQRMNDHNHDGSNSNKLTSVSMAHTTSSVPAANWSSIGNDQYRQTITTASAINANNYGIEFIDTATGKRYALDTERISDTQYYVYSNDNSLELTAIYV